MIKYAICYFEYNLTKISMDSKHHLKKSSLISIALICDKLDSGFDRRLAQQFKSNERWRCFLKKIKAPVDGMLLSLKVSTGDTVVIGQIVAVVLILKMENPVPSKYAGIVKEIPVKVKGRIKRGQVLMVIEETSEVELQETASPVAEPDSAAGIK